MTEPARAETAVAAADGPSPWLTGMLEQFEALGPEVTGRVATNPPASAEVVRGDAYADPEFLRESVLRAGHSMHGRLEGQAESDEERAVKVAAAASRFFRYYCASISVTASVALARGIGLDLAAHRCSKMIVGGLPSHHVVGEPGDGVVTCTERPAAWPIESTRVETLDELRRYVWRQLYGENLAPLIARTTAATRLPAPVLWSNAAEVPAFVAELAADHLSASDAAPFVADADALFDADTLPGVEGPNPLRGLIEWVPVDEPDFPHGVQTRPQCCITYVLPVRTGLLCGNCPFLSVEERMALVRERRTGERGGPAEWHSIEVGRRKIRDTR